ncbi:MAG: sugar phosphate isomerase/epimerase [Cyanobacteria bacterium M_surface_10_m2_119]|nr:sugar phosphate isomerase/epimerase [Cyanobacteria bacterium M_surface_10_m2_119]
MPAATAACGSRPLLLFSLWGFEADLAAACTTALREGFDGLEVNLRHPALAGLAAGAVVEQLAAAGLQLVLELLTGGDYVPDLACTPEQHLRELEEQLAQAPALRPLRVTVLTGSDSWPWPVQEAFWRQALAAGCAVPVSFETHRSRSFYSPWLLQPFLEAFPDLRLTADLSHWCAVAERLMTPELEPVRAMAARVDHIHALVGHAQGPSVGHPFAPEWGEALEAHRRCWQLFARERSSASQGPFTITPEFGPDGYLPQLPFTRQPVADLLELNTAMAQWLREEVEW